MYGIPEDGEVRLYKSGAGNVSITLVKGGVPVTTITMSDSCRTSLSEDVRMLYDDEIPGFVQRVGIQGSIIWCATHEPYAVVKPDWSIEGDDDGYIGDAQRG